VRGRSLRSCSAAGRSNCLLRARGRQQIPRFHRDHSLPVGVVERGERMRTSVKIVAVFCRRADVRVGNCRRHRAACRSVDACPGPRKAGRNLRKHPRSVPEFVAPGFFLWCRPPNVTMCRLVTKVLASSETYRRHETSQLKFRSFHRRDAKVFTVLGEMRSRRAVSAIVAPEDTARATRASPSVKP
jgi:hypothetical protein